jgi:MFS superfamily sulfate permease-like transporter
MASRTMKRDVFSGIIVFLVALPLCLGIAQASHAPLFSGILSGIIGGIVVGALSGSSLSVSGPAAGLTAIVFASITKLQSFDIFLCAVIVAGAVQMLLGAIRAGKVADFMPSSVIEGMLAGIGLTILVKQIPDAVGNIGDANRSAVDTGEGFWFGNINALINHVEPAAAGIAAAGIAVMAIWQTKPMQKLRVLPAGLVVVLIGIATNYLLGSLHQPAMLGGKHLVALPVATSLSDFLSYFTLPDLNGFLNPAVWETGVVIAAVASIESLLSVEATDKLDPQKKYTPANRELIAQGAGNLLAGLVGAIPLTSVIVRSSANINAGARTKLSTVLHGVLLLVCVATIPATLNLIPKAALAAILMFTGYKLCRPSVFVHTWKSGLAQFVPFVATAAAVFLLDLLKGVGIGVGISVIYMLRQNIRIPYSFERSAFSNGELIKLTLAQEVSFLNKASIKETLNNIPKNSSVIIDASQTKYIDFDVLELIKEFAEAKAPERSITVSLIDFKNRYQVPKTVSDTELLSALKPNNKAVKRSAGSHKKLLKQLKNETADE